MATKSEESLRAFVEEEEPVPAAAPASSPVPAVLPGILPPAPVGSTGAKSDVSGNKPGQKSGVPKKAAGGSKPTPEQQKKAKAAEAATTQIQGSLTDAGNRLTDRIAGWDTPGGIGLLLLALFILLWMIVPVNGGHTRFGLLWLTLTGQTSLPDDASVPSNGSGGLGGLGGCPPGYIPDGKGGCQPAGAPFPGFPGLNAIPFSGSAFPDLSGPNGFTPGQLLGV